MAKKAVKKKTYYKSSGQETGMSICIFYANLFESNELVKRPLTDPQIAAKVAAEFPNRKEPSCSVNQYRCHYNAGNLTSKLPPAKVSLRYNHLGQVVDGRTGRRVLFKEEVVLLEKKHAKRVKAAKKKRLAKLT